VKIRVQYAFLCVLLAFVVFFGCGCQSALCFGSIRGTSYWNLGQADNAIAEFQKSMEVDPFHAQTLYNLGVVYIHGKNNPAEARKAWEKLLATNPNYPERARVQEQINALAAAPAMPASSGAGKKGDARGVEDLLQRMKSRP
jgi:tetratricopeptide (TPR) repeat protein